MDRLNWFPMLKNGRKMDIWSQYARVTEGLIKREGLQPLNIKVVAAGAQAKTPMMATTGRPLTFRKLPFPGIPVPHLHFNGKIYEINEAQWKQFSAAVIKDFKIKLDGMKAVGLEQMAVISGALKG